MALAQHSQKVCQQVDTLSLTYEEFLFKSDADLYALFCIEEISEEPNPCRIPLTASKEMARKGMTSYKQ